MTTTGENSSNTEDRVPLSSASQDAFVDGLKSYYAFLSRLHSGFAEMVRWPPPGGWPQITAESLSALNKNATVISLLKQIPYVSWQNVSDQTPIIPDTPAIPYKKVNYIRKIIRAEGRDTTAFTPTTSTELKCSAELPPHVVTIARGNRDSHTVYVDTDEWRVYWMDNQGNEGIIPPGTFLPETDGIDKNGPMWWKLHQAWKPEELFEVWKNYFRTCRWMLHPNSGADTDILDVMMCEDGEILAKGLKPILRKHGLLEDGEGEEFQHDEAWKEIEKWCEVLKEEGYQL